MIFPHDVPGWLSEKEGRKLAELAERKVVLEIGSYHGRSTICMAQTAKVVHSVDWHRGDEGSDWGWTLPDFTAWLERYAAHNVCVHVGTTAMMRPVFADECCDMAFIDGAHDYDSVVLDLRFAERKVRPGGLIVMHDSHYSEVERAIQDVLGGSEKLTGSLSYAKAGCLSGHASP